MNVNEMTEIVKKLKKNSDLLEKLIYLFNFNHCLYIGERKAKRKRRSGAVSYLKIRLLKTIFVEGFRCTSPRDGMKNTLIKHFSPCGKVSRVSIPFHCKTGSPMGFVSSSSKFLTI
ncbi:RRM domain-containing protein [Raphanus sativus]|nr:RRM domain-containing protein [Raphanus sativus]